MSRYYLSTRVRCQKSTERVKNSYRPNGAKKPYHHRREKFLECKNLTLANFLGHSGRFCLFLWLALMWVFRRKIMKFCQDVYFSTQRGSDIQTWPKTILKWVKTHIEGSHAPNRPRLDGPTTVAAGPKGLPARSEGPDVLTSK